MFASMNEYLLQRLRYSLFVIRWEDDLQFFAAVHCMHFESKNFESLVMAQVEVCKSGKREIRDDSAELVQVSSVLARRGFFLRNQHKLALGDQQCAGRREFSLKSSNDGGPLCGGKQPLVSGPITQRLVAELYRPSLGYRSAVRIIIGRGCRDRIDAVDQVGACTSKWTDSFEEKLSTNTLWNCSGAS